jgi:hypothetical protein
MAYHVEELKDLEKGDIVRYVYQQNALINTLGFRCSSKRVGFFIEYSQNSSELYPKGYARFADMKSNSNLSCSSIDKKNGFHHKRKISLDRLLEIELLKKC